MSGDERPEPEEPAREPDTNGRKRSFPTAAQVSAAVAAGALVLGALTFLGLNTPAVPSGAPGQVPSASSPPLVPSVIPAGDVFDDFSGPMIDTTRWRIADPGGAFRQTEGRLIGSSTPTEATMTARSSRPVTSVDFDVSVLDASGPNRGGLFVILVGERGQRRIAFGPTEDSGIQGYSIESCPDESCASKSYPADQALEVGRSYPVTIDATGPTTVMTVEKFAPVVLDGTGRVKEVRIYEFSSPGTVFRAAIDNLRLGYA